MKYLLFFISILLICSNCSKKKNEFGRINLEKGFNKKEFILLSEVAKNVEYLFFETNDSCLMTNIRKIVYNAPFYFVTDYRKNSIFIFDETGKFVNNISSVG